MTYREYVALEAIWQIHRRLSYCQRANRPTGTEFWRFEYLNAITCKFEGY